MVCCTHCKCTLRVHDLLISMEDFLNLHTLLVFAVSVEMLLSVGH